MGMQTPQDLFLHELGDMYDAERRILQMLPAMATECDNDQVRQEFQRHEQETKQQAQNLEQCFQALGAKPPQTTCAAIAGMKQEHDSFLKEKPAPEILTMFDLGGASKTEHYEIASYTSLIEQAQLMGQQECARLLQQNLQQEQAMAMTVRQLSQKLGIQAAQRMGQMTASQSITGDQSAAGI